MKRIWEFFENLNEIVYASDMDTHELVYLNKKARDNLGIPDVRDVSHKKCYEILQGASAPCAMCTNPELKPGYFTEWRYYNPRIGKHVSLKDTMIYADGRRYRIEIAMDDSIRQQQSNLIHQYQDMEAIANEGFQLALKAPTPDLGIQVLLEYLGKALRGERAYIFERNENGNDDNTYEWVAEGISAEIHTLQDLPAEVCANWYRNFQINKNILISDLEHIREDDPLQYENLKRQNIHSLVVVPLYDRSKIIGFYGIDNPPVESVEYASNILQITASFIIAAIRRRNTLRQLQSMSHHDQLTGLGNRYAVDEYIEQLDSRKNLAVLFCDITGLKHTNDTQGHRAGDELILRACDCLKQVFDGHKLFRVGGDELLVMGTELSREQLREKTMQLKQVMKENNVNMATGAVWKPAGKKNLDALLTEAEQLMYEDKAEYYRISGANRRK